MSSIAGKVYDALYGAIKGGSVSDSSDTTTADATADTQPDTAPDVSPLDAAREKVQDGDELTNADVWALEHPEA